MEEADLFLEDFVHQLVLIDQWASEAAKTPQALVFAYTEEHSVIKPHHSDDLVTYFPEFPQVPCLAISESELERKRNELQFHFSAYVIWKDITVRHFRTIFDKGQGIGHAALKQMWLLLAIRFVRYRVLSHPALFRYAKLRSFKTLAKHRFLFADGQNEFAGMQAARTTYAQWLPATDRDDPYHIDAFLTYMLFHEAILADVPIEHALRYVLTD